MSPILHPCSNLSMAHKTTHDALSAAYLDWSRTNAPVNTTKSRASSLRTLPNAGTATREQVEAWWTSRAHLSPATRHNDLAHLRTFYRWCQRWEHRADDPTTRLDSPHVNPGLPRPMSRDDLHTALDSLYRPDIRRAVCLGAYAGLRVSEAAALDWSNVDLENMQIRVMNSKGNKSRRVPISPVLLDALLPNTGGNVVSGGVPYSTARLMRRVHRAFQSLGIDCTFHQLRHRYATLAYEATGDLLVVSRLLGHANISTTAGYVRTRQSVAEAIALAVVA
jgi:integrase